MTYSCVVNASGIFQGRRYAKRAAQDVCYARKTGSIFDWKHLAVVAMHSERLDHEVGGGAVVSSFNIKVGAHPEARH